MLLTFGVEIEGKYTNYLKILILKLQLQVHCSDLKVYEYTSVLLLYFFPVLPFNKGKEFL